MHEELELVASALKSVIIKLQSANLPSSEPKEISPSGDEEAQSPKEFREICAQAGRISGELLGKLEALRVNHGKNRFWESTRAAVKTAWSKDEIRSLIQRLSILRESLDSETISMIW